jgi:Sec-independent protein secretion pathway component TatC
MIPLMILFESSIWLSFLFDRRSAQASSQAAAASE